MNSNSESKRIVSELENENETYSFYPPANVPVSPKKIPNCFVDSPLKNNSTLTAVKSPSIKAVITAHKRKIQLLTITLLVFILFTCLLFMGMLYWVLSHQFVQKSTKEQFIQKSHNISSVSQNETQANPYSPTNTNSPTNINSPTSTTSQTQVCESETLRDIQDVLIYVSYRNMDSLGFLIVGKHPGYPLKRSLLKFENPPKICNSTNILRANMYIKFWYAHKASYLRREDYPYRNITLQLYKVNKSWSEKEANSKYRRNGQAWNSLYLSLDGSDADAAPQDSIRFYQGQRSNFVEFDVTNAVRDWTADHSMNHGFLFKVVDEAFEGRDTRFYSREAAPANRPYVQILYSN